MRCSCVQCTLPGDDDRLRRHEVRFADLHMHDVVALRLEGARTRQNLHDLKRCDLLHMGGETAHVSATSPAASSCR